CLSGAAISAIWRPCQNANTNGRRRAYSAGDFSTSIRHVATQSRTTSPRTKPRKLNSALQLGEQRLGGFVIGVGLDCALEHLNRFRFFAELFVDLAEVEEDLGLGDRRVGFELLQEQSAEHLHGLLHV